MFPLNPPTCLLLFWEKSVILERENTESVSNVHSSFTILTCASYSFEIRLTFTGYTILTKWIILQKGQVSPQ